MWTLVLGCIFVNEVYVGLTTPEFSATLLTLTGLSSATFLAGKSNELSSIKPAPANLVETTTDTSPAAETTPEQDEADPVVAA